MSHTHENPMPADRSLGLADPSLYLASSLLVAGNVVLPVLVHRIPMGGPALMPILFFTLIAGWEFGLPAALFTATLSPLVSHGLTGMPQTPALTGIILSSAALGLAAVAISRLCRRTSLLFLALTVLVHQGLVVSAGCLAMGLGPSLRGLLLRVPGILLQVLGGWAVLKGLERLRSRETMSR